MMEISTILVLVAAGLAGGAANAIAGGATLITFPAMMAAGLPPIIANASNAVATSSGNLMGAWSERDQFPRDTTSIIPILLAAIIGGTLGALLLLNTSEATFVLVVPALIAVATLVFGFSKRIQAAVAARFGHGERAGVRAALVVPAALYGGYFGAGLGVVLMAVLSATSNWELRTANALKNVLSVLANAAAIMIFAWQGVISWPETLIMMAAALTGGAIGGKLLKVLPQAAVKKAILCIGTLMSIMYAWRYWL